MTLEVGQMTPWGPIRKPVDIQKQRVTATDNGLELTPEFEQERPDLKKAAQTMLDSTNQNVASGRMTKENAIKYLGQSLAVLSGL